MREEAHNYVKIREDEDEIKSVVENLNTQIMNSIVENSKINLKRVTN
jgi:hypothetical protein